MLACAAQHFTVFSAFSNINGSLVSLVMKVNSKVRIAACCEMLDGPITNTSPALIPQTDQQ